jgi:DNA-binding GntR family transcriptional regulator
MLQDAILSEELRPGDRLSVSELARQMNISRTPVREAVQRLVYDGLAVHVPYRGVDVVRVGVDDLRQLFEVREVLDGLAAKIACRRIQPDDLHELRQILQGHEAILDRDAPSKDHIERDMKYHGRIRELAGNLHLAEMLGRIHGKSHLAIHTLWRDEVGRRLALSEHWQIYHALAKGDPVAAEQAARLHVARIQRRLPKTAPDPETDMPASARPGGGHPTAKPLVRRGS